MTLTHDDMLFLAAYVLLLAQSGCTGYWHKRVKELKEENRVLTKLYLQRGQLIADQSVLLQKHHEKQCELMARILKEGGAR
jgi:hypothetical protein